jgi:fumarate reductase (CoM/CoB) subunit A
MKSLSCWSEAVTLAASLDRLAEAFAAAPEPALDGMAQALRQAMQRHCLVEKTAAGLGETLALAEALDAAVAAAPGMSPETLPAALSRANLALCARLVLQACLNRNETRGAHNRVDCPARDDARHGHSYVLRRQGEAAIISPLAY